MGAEVGGIGGEGRLTADERVLKKRSKNSWWLNKGGGTFSELGEVAGFAGTELDAWAL
jgi:hypothetical protein